MSINGTSSYGYISPPSAYTAPTSQMAPAATPTSPVSSPSASSSSPSSSSTSSRYQSNYNEFGNGETSSIQAAPQLTSGSQQLNSDNQQLLTLSNQVTGLQKSLETDVTNSDWNQFNKDASSLTTAMNSESPLLSDAASAKSGLNSQDSANETQFLSDVEQTAGTVASNIHTPDTDTNKVTSTGVNQVKAAYQTYQSKMPAEHGVGAL